MGVTVGVMVRAGDVFRTWRSSLGRARPSGTLPILVFGGYYSRRSLRMSLRDPAKDTHYVFVAYRRENLAMSPSVISKLEDHTTPFKN